jgi:hypothetical protein
MPKIAFIQFLSKIFSLILIPLIIFLTISINLISHSIFASPNWLLTTYLIT